MSDSGFVLVPCPEEHVEQFRTVVMGLALGAAGWDRTTFDALSSRCGDREARLLEWVARQSIEGGRPPFDAVARGLHLDPAVAMELVFAVNGYCADLGRPALLMITASRDDEGRAVPSLHMPIGAARAYLEARRPPDLD